MHSFVQRHPGSSGEGETGAAEGSDVNGRIHGFGLVGFVGWQVGGTAQEWGVLGAQGGLTPILFT